MRTNRTAPVPPGRGESLAENSHAIAASWDLQANGDITPRTIKAKSLYKAWWVCSTGHPRYRESVLARMKGARCPLCRLHGISSASAIPAAGESLADVDPARAALWDRPANLPLTPEVVKPGSTISVWWACSTGHPRYRARIDRHPSGAACPECAGEASASSEGMSPVPAESGRASCPAGHRDYLPAPAAGKNYQGCPACLPPQTGVRINGLRYTRSLASHRPEVAADWDTESNGALTPADVLPSAVLIVWWKCAGGHSRYSMSPAYRCKTGRGCTDCRRENPETPLSAENPGLSSQWDLNANGTLTPDDLPATSMRLVSWKCEDGHSFRATVKQRHDSGDGCPLCLTQDAGIGQRWPDYSPGWQQK